MRVSDSHNLSSQTTGPVQADARRKQKYDNIGYLFILPVVVFFCLFFIYPLGYTIRLSFYEWTGFSNDMTFVGLRNLHDVFSNWVFWTAAKNTILYAIVQTSLQTALGLILALVLDSRLLGREMFKVLFFTPVLVSIAVVSLLWGRIFEPNFGLLNGLLTKIGLGVLARPWLGDSQVALFAVISVSVWQGFGYSMVLFLAGLQNVLEDLKEAAKIDGASDLGVIWHITLPLLRPVIALVATLTLIGALKVFEIIYVMTSGGPNHATETISSLLYYEAFRFNHMGIASAIAVVLLIGTMAMSILQRRVMERESEI